MLALIVGVIGAVIGRGVPRGAPSVRAATSAYSTAPTATPASLGCKAERSDLASTNARLAICMAFGAIVGFVAAILPAWTASRTPILDTLRATG